MLKDRPFARTIETFKEQISRTPRKEILLIFNEKRDRPRYVHPFPRLKTVSLASLCVQFDRP